MLLNELLEGLNYELIQGEIDKKVDQIIYDSRIKTQNGLFVAITGYKTDGHKYINAAIENGAKVIIAEKDVYINNQSITIVKVSDSRYALACISANKYDHPSTKLQLIGVTGTNGKTSITYLLGQILEEYNHKIGIVGTIENRIGKEVVTAERTTPESLELQGILSKMVENDITYALMEVSSHALNLKRVDKCAFELGIFTNLTQDHLDFHSTMDEYAKAKAKLFKLCKTGIINIDSEYASVMMEDAACNIQTYGIDNHAADYYATNIKITAKGTSYVLNCKQGTFNVYVPIPGKFTVYNTLAVIASAAYLSIPMENIINSLAHISGVPGRVQSFTSNKGYTVLIDYAHTPDGLKNVLEAITEFADERIITVFGCGGDRDRTKRPIMGEIAACYSDYVIITSDNPRSEDPIQIINEIEGGVNQHTKPYEKIEDRKEAIAAALKKVSKGDVVLIAGKGHENYQILKDKTIHFDDSEIVQQIIQEEQK